MVDEIRTTGWFERIGNSIKGVLFGGLLFVVAFPVLFWNEGRAVSTAKGLEEGAAAVVSVPSDKVDPANEKKLIHTTGTATASETLKDPDFPSAAAQAIRLERKSEIYQWKESKEEKKTKKVGGSETTETTYHYDKVWSKEPVDSTGFKTGSAEYSRLQPINKGVLNYPSKEWTAAKTTLGAFTLPVELLGGLKSENLEVRAEATPAPAESANPTGTPAVPPSAPLAAPKVAGGGFYFGANPSTPEIGDVRLTYGVVKPQPVSVLGVQAGDTLAGYTTRQGTTIFRLDPGTITAEGMFAAAQAENTMMTWILRLVGFIMMFIGLCMIVGPLGVLADVLPIMGDFVRFGTGLAAGAIALACSLVTIAVAWIFYRPVLGVALLAVAIGLIVFLKTASAKKAVPGGA